MLFGRSPFFLPALFLCLLLFTGCDERIEEKPQLNKKALAFFENLLQQNYDSCMVLMEEEDPDRECGACNCTRLSYFDTLRTQVLDGIGPPMKYHFLSQSYRISRQSFGGYTNRNARYIYLEYYNDEYLAALEFLIDVKTEKIIDFGPIVQRSKIPAREPYYLFILLSFPLCFFYVFVLVKTGMSNTSRKLRKFLLILFLNFPAFFFRFYKGISYESSPGFSLWFLPQPLFPLRFNISSYADTYIFLFVPVGAIWVSWQLYREKKMLVQSEQE